MTETYVVLFNKAGTSGISDEVAASSIDEARELSSAIWEPEGYVFCMAITKEELESY